MTRRAPIAALAALIAFGALFSGVAMGGDASATPEPRKAKTFKLVRTWSYVGPRGNLAGARITVRDASGKVIARGTTSKVGSYKLDLKGKTPKLPLTVSTSGGRVMALLPSGRFVSLGAFKGHLSAPVFGVTREPITQVSLISTAAGKIAESNTRAAYAKAVTKVERALGFTTVVPSDILRLRNGDVGFKQLLLASRRAGGFDAFADRVAEAALARKKIARLRPPSAAASGAISQRLIRGKAPLVRQSSSSSGPICSSSLPSGQSTSDELITDIAEVGVGALMKVAGTPSGVASSVTGMAFSAMGVPTSASTAEANAAAMFNELQCIDEQLVYLTAQVDGLALTAALTNATTCADAINGPYAYQAYQDVIGGGTTAPIDPNDQTLSGLYMPTWFSVSTTCGNGVNASLFTASGGNKTGWQQMVANTVGSSKWWTPAQVQQMQSFLSYWGAIVYKQFILSNEYDYYNGYVSGAANAAGAATDSSGQTLCQKGSTSSTSTFCVYRSNIMGAYPADLYSDELGVLKGGLAVLSVPIGMVAPTPIMDPAPSGSAAADRNNYSSAPSSTMQGGTITAGNVGWFYNYYLNFTGVSSNGYGNKLQFPPYGGTPWCVSKVVNACPPSLQAKDFAWDVAGWYNGLGINPKGYGSAVETYNNPQFKNRYPHDATGDNLSCSDVSDINTTNNLGQTGITALYNALNQAPNGGSGPLTSANYGSGDIAYWVSDNNGFTAQKAGMVYGINLWSMGCLGKTGSISVPPGSTLPSKPMFAQMLGRAWWTGASTAATYTPGNPATVS